MTSGTPPAAGRPDSGSASVLVLSLSAVVVLVACVLVALGTVATTRQRAASAADLGALAAAGAVLQGQPVACARAARVVEAAGGRLASCRLVGDVAEVDVTVRPAGRLAVFGVTRGAARAGPI